MSSRRMQFAVKTGLPVIVKNLESLIECLKRGTLHISRCRRSLVLHPADPVTIELKAQSKQDRPVTEERVVLTLKWESAGSPLPSGEAPVSISTGLSPSAPYAPVEGAEGASDGEEIGGENGEAPAEEPEPARKAPPRKASGGGKARTRPKGKKSGRQG